MWKEKKPLSVVQYDSEYNEEGLARLCSTISVEPTAQENVTSSVSVEKKSNLSFMRAKRTQIALILQRLKTRKNPNILVKCN